MRGVRFAHVRFALAQYGQIPKTMARVATDLREAVEDPGPPVESRGTAASIPAASLPEFVDTVDFAMAGTTASGDFRCADCGYGVSVQQILPPCPMCRGAVWEQREPFAADFPC